MYFYLIMFDFGMKKNIGSIGNRLCNVYGMFECLNKLKNVFYLFM